MSLKNMFWAIVGASILMTPGCGSKNSPKYGTLVVGGETLESNTTSAVAIMKSDGFDRFYTYCSGVLISPKKVLTAAHCFHRDMPLEEFRIAVSTAKPDAENPSSLYKILKINQYPGFLPKEMLRSHDGVFRPSHAGDLGVWELEKEVNHVASASFTESAQEPLYFVDNQPFVVMGFGKKSSWESDFSAAQLARAVIPFFKISTQTASIIKSEGGRSIKRNIPTTLSSRSEHEFFLGGIGMADTCKGDSGGPVFIESDGQLTLIGITSRGTKACNAGGLYTLLSPKIKWIKSLL